MRGTVVRKRKEKSSGRGEKEEGVPLKTTPPGWKTLITF